MRKIILGASLLSILTAQYAIADQAAIIEFRQKQVDLFDAQGQQPLERRETATLPLPMPIIGAPANGFYLVEIEAQDYAIRKRAVRTNRDYTAITGTCSNIVAVAPGAVTRGLGKGEC